MPSHTHWYKVYLSRDVVFDENLLPFQKPSSVFSSINDTGEPTTFDEWVSALSVLSDPMHLTSVISNARHQHGHRSSTMQHNDYCPIVQQEARQHVASHNPTVHQISGPQRQDSQPTPTVLPHIY